MMSLQEVQDQLDEETQLIEYFWTDSILFSLSLSNQQAILYKIKLPIEFNNNLDRIFKKLTLVQLDDSAEMDNSYQSYASAAHQLFNTILSPVLLQDKKRIIISPDGPLSFLPFEALTTDSTLQTWQSAPYLLKTYDVNYTFSCNLLFGNLNHNRSKPSILAFAYTNADEDNESNEIPREYSDIRGRLTEIAGSSEEVDAIQRIFKIEKDYILKGRLATETAFKDLSEKFEVIHLSVHGEGDMDDELNSLLYFKDEPGSENDGRLYAHELYGLDFRDTRLVVMSACESGIGKNLEGEGTFSMARGFAYAGCSSSVMSLWNVNDRKTADLMSSFYENMHKGHSISYSLVEAKKSFIQDAEVNRLAHPKYWAAFVLIGDSTPIVASSLNWKIWLMIGLVIGILFFFLRKK